jgi:F420-dependent oxidoreductase-like protein
MVGPERGRYATKIDRLRTDARWADEVGIDTIWIPQIPDEFDALTAAALVGVETSRVEIGTAVVPIQPRHPIAMAQQVLSTQAACNGRLSLGLGVSHHWVIDEMLGLPYERPVPTMRAYLDVLEPAFAGPGVVQVENDFFRVNNPLDVTDITPTPILLAALGPKMLELCGARTDGTILWMADEKAIESHVVPRLTAAASAAGRPSPRVVAGIPICLCADDEVDVAVARANRLLSEAEVSPNYQRLLDQGDAKQVGDLLAAGSESSIEKRIRSFADAGVTDISFRVVPIGDGRDELIASMKRTRQLIASLPGRV